MHYLNVIYKINLEQLKDHFSCIYNEEDIWYTVYNLKEIRFIDGRINDGGSHKMMFCEIENITWNGHQFLNTIRPTSVWEATKSGASKLGIMSVSALSMISSEITKAIITKQEVIDGILNKLNELQQ
ncbi:DUF2513 domain-containing protein [[Ruminococcus] torques]|uniref:DUF2513 domain-containing protein n=1 Tax=[Ruminococcus] torques TaxID=33039 RepID=UPI00402AEC16